MLDKLVINKALCSVKSFGKLSVSRGNDQGANFLRLSEGPLS
jgi:hypothetical protein